jgi:hypothetical protein
MYTPGINESVMNFQNEKLSVSWKINSETCKCRVHVKGGGKSLSAQPPWNRTGTFSYSFDLYPERATEYEVSFVEQSGRTIATFNVTSPRTNQISI